MASAIEASGNYCNRSRNAAVPALGRGEGTNDRTTSGALAAAGASLPLQGQYGALTPAAAILAAAHAGEKKLETVDVGRSTNIRW